MSYAPFFEGGDPPIGAPYELLSTSPESPGPKWKGTPGGRAMLVYAHPDDEILFAGGLMLAHPMWDWTLVCVTDPGRAEQQDKALDLLREEGVNIVEHTNLGFTDGFSPQPGYRSLIFRNVEATYQACEPHIVFTHGYRGEYGHHHHHWTHLAVHLACDNVWDFLHPNSRVKQLRKTLVREVPTDKRKNDIFRLAYGEVAAGLLANAPWITGPLLRGEPEYFTQGVVGL